MRERPRGWLLYQPFDDTDEWLPVGTTAEIANAKAALEATREAAHSAGIGGPPGWMELWDRILPLERELARLQGEEYAIEIEVAAPMDTGAPEPSVISHEGARTSVIYFARDPTHVVDHLNPAKPPPMDRNRPQLFGVLTFPHAQEVLFGGPNEEALQKHRLDGRGLRAYAVHEVMNSRWAALTWDYNTPAGVPSRHRARHFIVAFHDSLLEVLARDIQSRKELSRERDLLADVAQDRVPPPHSSNP